MDDTKVSGASMIIEISGKELSASPLTDKQLDSLTNYVRYIINKRARKEAEFAESMEEAAEIQGAAFAAAQGIIWFEPSALAILSSPEGTVKVAIELLKKENPDLKRDWLTEQFGDLQHLSAEQLANTLEIRRAFTELNSFTEEVVSPEKVKKSKKKQG